MDSSSNDTSWNKRLKDGEANPSDGAWDAIALQLDGQEVIVLRKRVLVYKRLAVACVGFALLASIGSYTFTNSTSKSSATANYLGTLVPNTDQSKDLENTPAPLVNRVDDSLQHSPLLAKYPMWLFADNTSASEHEELGNENLNLERSRTMPRFSILKQYSLYDGDKYFQFNNNYTIPLATVATQQSAEAEQNPVEDVISKKSKKSKEKFWTAVGFSAGTFTNTTPTDASTAATLLRSSVAGNTAASESNTSGYTYSINVAMGTKISKRWLLQGGLSYIAQLSDYTATSVLSDPSGNSTILAAASLNQFERQAEDRGDKTTILASTPYSVNNTVQIISLPVQAGYVIFERKLALQINSGLATDLFIQNTITPDAENLKTTTQGRGETSPYRPINVSGLLGTELSYKVGQKYRVALSPGVRYPFNSIYKTDLGIRSTPLTFDVALRFRYIFK